MAKYFTLAVVPKHWLLRSVGGVGEDEAKTTLVNFFENGKRAQFYKHANERTQQ